jgi:iron complex transport system substrate-binding protein
VTSRHVIGSLCLTLMAGIIAACHPATPTAPTPSAAVAARRIVTLSPHLAELAYSAGAGDWLVGVVEFSDFPPPVAKLPRVGDAFRVDYEAVAALKPDLILAWTSGNPPETVQRLRDLGFRVVSLEPADLADIGAEVAEIGALAGTAPVANAAAAQFASRLAALRAAAQGAAPLNVFVQLSERPYFTVTDRHFIGQGLQLCGGRNVFGTLPGLTAIVALESILEAAPDVIVASDMGGTGEWTLAGWARWKDLPAVKRGNLYALNADLLSRPSARILDGVAGLCGILDEARLTPKTGENESGLAPLPQAKSTR